MDMRETLKQRHDSLGLRFFLLFASTIAVISISFTVMFYQQQRRILRENVTHEGQILARLLAHNARLGVFAENGELLKDPVEGILQHEGVLFVSVISAAGTPIREQAHGKMLKTPGRKLPNWNAHFNDVRASWIPHAFEEADLFEFWAPIVSIAPFQSADALILGHEAQDKEKILGYARIIVDKQPLKRRLDTFLFTCSILAGGFLVLSTILTYLVVRRITNPLDRLTVGIKALEQGGGFVPVKVERNHEIGRLANAFNHMAETLKKREAEKEQLAEELRHAQKMEAIGTLAGGVAHDFNNILTAIVGFGTLLQRSLNKDNPYQIYVDQILNAADRATTLVKRLLAFGRKQVITPFPTDLNGIIQSIEKLLARLVSEDVEFKVSLFQEPLVCHVDSGQIDQILMNLVTNARDAMPAGGRLTLTTDATVLDENSFGSLEQCRPGRYAVLTISDTGFGMDQETKERIFDPFFTTKEVGKGTGLGLSMVYGIVRQHEGFVTVDSEPGTGTTFRIYLPIVALSARVEEEAPPVVTKGNRETVLLAEDDKAVRKLSRHVLERNGYEVIEATDGNDAVKKFTEAAGKIDLVLLDVVMPGKNGQVAYAEMKRIQPAVKALFISGYTKDIIGSKGFLAEDINFIAKPVKPDQLIARVQEVLKN